MDIVKQNPYRVLGVLGNASERELQKQITVIKRFAEVGKSKSFDSDFDFVGQLARTTKDVQLAASKIEQAHKKVYYALFWFINVNQFDEIAFSNLKNGNQGKAIDLWNKTLKDDVTEKNYSSYQNLSTLYITTAIIDGQLDLDKISMAVELKGLLIYSNILMTFFEVVAGKNLPVDKNSIGEIFVDEIVGILNPYLDRASGIKASDVIALFSTYPHETKKYVSNKYTEIPLLNVEREIDKAKEKRQENPSAANEYGKDLFWATKADVNTLRAVLSKAKMQMQMVINNISAELLQCSIDYFNEWYDSNEVDPGNEALEIISRVITMGPTGQVKDRLDENLPIIKEWVDNQQQRVKVESISEEMDFIVTELTSFNKKSGSVIAINDLVKVCQPKLKVIKNVLGKDDASYRDVCDAVVSVVMGAVIAVFNLVQNQVVTGTLNENKLKILVAENILTLDSINSFDMTQSLRLKLQKNKEEIVSISSQLGTVAQQQSKGCYVATMAYGDYDHSQVIILRRYRDDVLANNFFGRIFIRVYYATSPYLVTVLTNKKNMNAIIRQLLDQWIKVIK